MGRLTGATHSKKSDLFCIGSGSFMLATGDKAKTCLLPQLKLGLIHGPLRDQLG